MAKVSLSAEVTAYLADRIAAFPKEANEQIRWQAPFVAEHSALPLYLGWTESIGIRADGLLVGWSHEGDFSGIKEVVDPIWLRIALVEGAKRYPVLKQFIPARPENARTCES